MVTHTSNPSTWETKADGLSEFQATLDYIRLNPSERETEPTVMAHTFNFSIRELEMGSDMAGCREEYMAGGNSSSGFSLRFIEKTFSGSMETVRRAS